MIEPTRAILLYVLAKDGNWPSLLDEGFREDATLRVRLRTDAIAFPTDSVGREAIARTFVRRFNQDYENIWTFCLGARPECGVGSFSCRWLVAMSEKAGGAVRFGCGTYDWVFAADDGRIREMTIAIDAMETLPAKARAPVLAWASALPYPWCTWRELDASPSPGIGAVDAVLACLRENEGRRAA
jgi:hypothetical protein